MKLIQLAGILALITLLEISANSDGIRQLADKLASIIGQQHDEHHQESFDCWFYCPVSTIYGEDLLDKLLVFNALQGIPLIHVSSTVYRFSATIPHPRLIVALLDTLNEDLLMVLTEFFNRFEQNIIYIVIFRWTTLPVFNNFVLFAHKLRLFNILYVPVNDHLDAFRLASFDIPTNRIYIHPLHADASSLFPDQFQNMRGRVAKFSAIHDPPATNFDTTPPSGYDILLATTIAERLNVTINPIQFICKAWETSDQCINRKIATEPNCFHLERIEVLQMSGTVITTLIPVSSAIIVPSSGSWTVVELLSKPFEVSLVICIILYCAGAMLIMLLFPNLFRNNLILLPFFGFEKQDLHRTMWLERWPMLAVVVVTFVVRSAYECKMISIITNRPYRPAVTSLDELYTSGLKVRSVITHLPPATLDDPRLAGVLEYAPGISHVFDEKYGYMIDSRYIAMCTNLMEALALRFRYMALPGILNTRYAKYYFGARNMYKDKFEQLQRTIFDVGIYNRWMVQDERERLQVYRRILLSTAQESEKSLVTYEDLYPARVLLAIGYAVSVMTFCLELVWNAISMGIARKMRKFRTMNGQAFGSSRTHRSCSFHEYTGKEVLQTGQRRKSI